MKYIALAVFLLLTLLLQQAAGQDVISTVPGHGRKRIVDPMKATMLSAVFPGFGQVYNRKYWKIPLVYAGFGGVGYAVAYNSKWYNTYIKAYQDFTDKIPETASYLELIRGANPEKYDPVLHPATYDPSQASWIRDQLLTRIDYFKKYRDLSYIGIAAWYIISILDANVDASLFNYDVNENLAFTLTPFQVPLYNFASVGINLSLKINF
jgi:hypothetical protein